MKKQKSISLIAVVSLLTLVSIFSQVTVVPTSGAVNYIRDQTLICAGITPVPNYLTCWNPYSPGNVYYMGEHSLMAEPFFINNLHTGEYFPVIGVSFAYSDGYKKITTKIRNDVKWSDGYPYTADDVVYSYNILIEQGAKLFSYGATVKEYVKSVTKVDDYTFTLELYNPNPRFHTIWMAYPDHTEFSALHIVPKHIWENVQGDLGAFDNGGGYNTVDTGPYKLVGASEKELIYQRRDDWWQTEAFGVRPAPKWVIYIYIGPAETVAIEMINHQCDSLFQVSASIMDKIKAEDPYVTPWVSQLPYHWIDPCSRGLIIDRVVYPYNITDVRRAIGYLVDREYIATVALEGTNKPNWGPFPDYAALYPYFDAIQDIIDEYEPAAYNPAKAEALLLENGFTRDSTGAWLLPTGAKWQLEILSRESEWDLKAIASSVCSSMREFGIDASWRALTDVALGDIRQTHSYDMDALFTCATADPLDYLRKLHSRFAETETLNWLPPPFGEDQAQYDEIIDAWTATSPLDNKEQCIEYFREAMEIYYKWYPNVNVVFATISAAAESYYWVGWPTMDPPNAWLQPPNWWMSFGAVIYGYRSPNANGTWVGGLRPRIVTKEVVYFTKDTKKFRGIDMEWYGPFKAGNSTRIPADDADYWIGKGYASYSPTIPMVDITGIAQGITQVQAQQESLLSKVEGLNAQIANTSNTILIEAVAIVVLAIAIVVILILKKT